MYVLSYQRLQEQTHNEKPFRGTHNRYPVGSRTQSNKYFLTEERNGESIARVIYGERRQYTAISKEMFYHLKNKINVVDRGSSTDPMFYRVDTVPNEMGIVREDNTFEFTAQNLTQGDNNILTKWSHGIFKTSVRHGGVVYTGFSSFHPIWIGARFNTETMQPHKPYQVFGLRVKRKEAKDHFKSYEKFFTVARTMSTAMEWENFERTAIDVINEHITGFDWGGAYGWYNPERDTKFLSMAKSLQDTAPLDAYVFYLCAYNSNVMTRLVTKANKTNNYYRTPAMHALYLGFHRRLTQEIYRATPELFKEVEYEAGKGFPANNWGIKVIVDGQQVKQY